MEMYDLTKQKKSLLDACNWVLNCRCGGSQYLADILLSCYNGSAYPCSLSNIKNFDHIRFEWAVDIITLHYQSRYEIHQHIKDGTKAFQKIAKEYKSNSDTTHE